MKIRLLTDSYIETFDGTVQQLLLGKVRKSPNPAGQGYVIQGSFHCRVSLCRVIKAREAEFNQMVNEARGSLAKP